MALYGPVAGGPVELSEKMLGWNGFIEEGAVAALLPSEYARFARPIRDGLTYFLERLPQRQQLAMLAAQAQLPLDATLAERLGTLARSSPVLQKLGQTVARDMRLSADFRSQLRQLESLPPTVSLAEIQQTLTQELGDLSALGVTLLPPAIAEASVAVVIPYRQVAEGTIRDGVFKLLKPAIEECLQRELEVLEQVGSHLDERCDELGIPHLDYAESFSFVRQKLSEETLLRQEQINLTRAQHLYADDDDVVIPQVFEHCTRRITAMQRLYGRKISDHGMSTACQQDRVARLVAKALLAKPMFVREEQGIFHADPHAGNLLYTDDQRLGILDWSLVGALGTRERIAIVQIVLAACTLNAPRMMRVIQELQERGASDDVALCRVVDNALRRIRCGELPGVKWLTCLLDDAVQSANVRLSADLMLFRKSLHAVEGVLGDTGSDTFNLDCVLLGEALLHFLVELPQRWFTLPHVREFATRLSSLDLWRTCLSGPATCTRFWMGQLHDMWGFARYGMR